MIYNRLLLVVLTISFLAGSTVASIARDAEGRLLKSSKSDKSVKATPAPTTATTTDTSTASPTAPPTEPDEPTDSPTKAPTASPTNAPTASPTTEAPTESPTGSPTVVANLTFKKVFFSTTSSFKDSPEAFDEAVDGQTIQFLGNTPCSKKTCISNGADPDCSRTDSNTLDLIANKSNKIQRFKGTSSFDISATDQTEIECCSNPTCIGKYVETKSFNANSIVAFSIENIKKSVIELKSSSWFELVVALYDDDTGDLVASNVYRGKDEIQIYEGQFTGLSGSGKYFLRIFPGLYSFKGNNKLKSKFDVTKLEIGTN